MMDKRTILVVIACILALIVSQRVINQMYPPKAKSLHPLAASVAPATNGVPPQAQAPAPAPTPAGQTAGSAAPAPALSEQPRSPEQIVTLSNAFMRVDVTSWGGGVRSV